MQSRRIPALAMALALAAPMALWLLAAPWRDGSVVPLGLYSDAIGYHRLALSILSAGTFTQDPETPEPELLRTPGYPLFLAGIYAVAGERPWLVPAFQIVLHALSAAVLFLAVRRAAGPFAGGVSALLLALDPVLMTHTVVLMSETLLVLLMTVALWVYGRALEAPEPRSRRWLFLLGAVLGAAALVKPIAGYAWAPLLLCLLCVKAPGENPASRRTLLSAAVAATAGFALMVSPWIARNTATFGVPCLSVSGPFNLLFLTVAKMEAPDAGGDEDEARRRLRAEAAGEAARGPHSPHVVNTVALAACWRRVAVRHILERPGRFLAVSVEGVAHLFSRMGTAAHGQLLGRQPGPVAFRGATPTEYLAAYRRDRGIEGMLLLALSAALVLAGYAGAALGLGPALRMADRRWVLFILSLTLYLVLATGAAGNARFRAPLVPLYLALAGIGWSRLLVLAPEGEGAPGR